MFAVQPSRECLLGDESVEKSGIRHGRKVGLMQIAFSNVNGLSSIELIGMDGFSVTGVHHDCNALLMILEDL